MSIRRRFVPLGCLLLPLLALAIGGAGWASSAPRAAQRTPPQRVEIAGTVFDQDGYTVKGCQVVVTNPLTKKHWDGETNPMGEFEIWVPAGKTDYLVRASAPHMVPDQEPVQIEQSEKVNIFLHLKKEGGSDTASPQLGS